jgi:DNA invertase Pin-like site-specific DNA recombinase
MTPLPALDLSRAIVLGRVSSVEQRDKGYGLDAQRSDCLAFAKREGLHVVEAFEGDERSTVEIEDRKAGAAALDAMVQHGAGTLLLARRDRLARDPLIAGLAKRTVAMLGGRILYATEGNGEDDSALFMDDIGHAAAAHDRRMTVARLRRGREEKAARDPHAYVGGRPMFGYRANAKSHTLEIDQDQAQVVREVFERVRDGQSVRKVAAVVGLHASLVQRILKYEPYKLKRPGQIVRPVVWNAANAALAARRRSPSAP